MNYQEEIIKIVRTITQERVLRFFYTMIRRVAYDPDLLNGIIALFGSE